MNCKIEKHVKAFIDIVRSGEYVESEDLVLFCKLVENAFKNEKLKWDDKQIEKYFSYEKYFPFKLFPWEKCLFVLHNCIFTAEGFPRFPELFIYVGRGSGKNGYLSFEDFCLMTDTHGIKEYDIDICANNEEQAETSFLDIYKVLESNKKIMSHFFTWNREVITNISTGSKLKYRTNNAKTKDGLRTGKVDFDELHAFENYDNLDVFTTGLGKKPSPRLTYTSTNGDVRESVLDDFIKRSEKILNGKVEDGGFLPFICRLTKESQVDNEENWHMANPSLRYLPHLLAEIRREYRTYKEEPEKHRGFIVKRMNLLKDKIDTVVTSWENIQATNQPVPTLMGKSCVCGVDYAKTSDFVSVSLVFKVKGKYVALNHSWFCTQSKDRRRMKFPVDEMARRGLVTMVDDVEINPTLVCDYINSMSYVYDIEKIAMDNYRYTLFAKELEKIGYSAIEKKVKLVRPSDIMKIQIKINSLFNTKRIVWGDDPLMRWFCNNTKLVEAPHGNFLYDKIEPKTRKTDGFMAFVSAMTLDEEIGEEADFTIMDIITI